MPGPQLCEAILQIEQKEVEAPGAGTRSNAWISVTRRISSKSEDIRYHQSSQTRSSSLTWLRQCSR